MPAFIGRQQHSSVIDALPSVSCIVNISVIYVQLVRLTMCRCTRRVHAAPHTYACYAHAGAGKSPAGDSISQFGRWHLTIVHMTSLTLVEGGNSHLCTQCVLLCQHPTLVALVRCWHKLRLFLTCAFQAEACPASYADV